ncbi:antitoxin [Scytonema hofmannii PCC 7110]|uniref:Antitoxin n=1 Tax=Scytonema hofmannii PCC 7110 TaxID=128403 RepID=A0A139X7Q8_9CYAN|nr:type II toxin-antitoxin system VapB family antitoxin [Scytonema hofmannii]KYC40737.1 antitoxin [Scytonema hofmannii PCC 7110]
MAINIQIEKAFIQDALALGNQQTERDVVKVALGKYVQRRKQSKVLELFGTIDYYEDYNYKPPRREP